jgi:hypothetical protein
MAELFGDPAVSCASPVLNLQVQVGAVLLESPNPGSLRSPSSGWACYCPPDKVVAPMLVVLAQSVDTTSRARQGPLRLCKYISTKARKTQVWGAL